MTEILERLTELQGARALPANPSRQRSPGAARRPGWATGPAAVLEQLPGPRRPPARAGGGRGRRHALGRGRRSLAPGERDDDRPSPPGGAHRGVQGHAVRTALRLGLPRQPRGGQRAGAQGAGGLLRRAQPRVARRRLPHVPRGDVHLRPRRRRASRLGSRAGRRACRPHRDRLGVLHGRGRRAADRDRRAGPASRRPRGRRRRPRDRVPGPGWPRRRRRGRPGG